MGNFTRPPLCASTACISQLPVPYLASFVMQLMPERYHNWLNEFFNECKI